MGRTLIQLMKEKEIKEGTQGRLKMALAIQRGERMVRRYIDGQSTPSSDTAFKLAKACGANDDEALQIANGFRPSGAKTA